MLLYMFYWSPFSFILMIYAQPFKATLYTKNLEMGFSHIHVKENAESGSYGSSLQHEGAHGTSSQTKKTAPSFWRLKRKDFIVYCTCEEGA